MNPDLVYYRRRSAEEAAAAARALDPRVRAVHLDLARRYSERVSVLEVARPDHHLRIVSAA